MIVSSARPGQKIDIQKTPVKVLKLPAGTDTGDLEDEDTVIGKQVVDILEESRVAADTDVLRNVSGY